jgi:hypothetical protein
MCNYIWGIVLAKKVWYLLKKRTFKSKRGIHTVNLHIGKLIFIRRNPAIEKRLFQKELI